ncbi:FAD/NAD(P)-binding domain-containing protein [Aaosphaeria arxii CBS 175.79]|uniref:FAD/NAD(P)-binding domain-containing protein n=1 Tax=Aaosphaeria arxii CBS 175.79 TaxID=1450172 RepID=A0A6A5XID9_9PLEO|nr:FAD/NAD(P)-binding domain-containing protein [Aaosphaeria arxii CBS 175.79]KAF2013035.1 FAD/NAD(P)-binding domain-containing protein [Aaosphaeria arxii CBS 175.79]
MPHALTGRDSTMESRPVGTYDSTGIDVLIVGTGLAGLVAALECVRKGHNVRVLERNESINTAGDMYFMGLSATRFMKHWPELQEEYKRISLHNAWIETFKHSGEVIIKPLRVADRLRDQGLDPDTPPGEFQMRPLVYKMFVSAVEKLGVSVEFNRRVVDYYEDEEKGKGGCVTDDGKRYEADVIIAADGVGSKSQKLVGGQVRARPSGRAMWRAAFPVEYLDQNPKVKEFFKLMPNKESIVRTWLGPSTYALTLTREDVMVWIMNHDVTGTEKENWNNTIDKEEVLEGMDKMPGMEVHKWAPIFRELVECTPPNTIVNFELLWRDPQPSWTSPGARVIQIGDAAHSYLPASGNGATQAIEDAISIASCLEIGGKDNVPQSVRTHIRFRFIRNACAQKLGFSNAELLQDTDWDKVKLDPRRAAPKLPRWVWSHDPEAYAYENYHKAVESMKKGVRMEDEQGFEPNYPRGYKYEPWSIEKIMEDMRAGVPIELGAGDWD